MINELEDYDLESKMEGSRILALLEAKNTSLTSFEVFLQEV
jgi:hypothetical protein